MSQEKVKLFLQKVDEYIKNEEYEQAESLLSSTIQKNEIPIPQCYGRLALVYMKTNNIQKSLTLLQKALSMWPKNTMILGKLAQSHMMNKEYEKAVEIIISIPVENRTSLMQNILVNAYMALDDMENIVREIRLVNIPIFPINAGKVIMYLFKNIDINSLHELVLEFIPKTTDKKSFFNILQHHLFRKMEEQWIESATEESLLSYLYVLKHSEYFTPEPKYIIKICEYLNQLDEHQKIIDILEKYSLDGEYNIKAEWLLMIAKIFVYQKTDESDNSFKPNEILLDNSVFYYRFGNSKCLVWFTGVDISNTARMLDRIKPLLKQYEISLFIVYDKTTMFSLLGFGSFIPDRVLSVRKLDQIIKEKGYTSVATSASSGSGLSAILYGLDMNVNGILTFNGVTKLPQDTLDTDPKIIKAKQKIFRGYTLPLIDSFDAVKRHPNTLIHLVYSEGFPFDKENAEYLKIFQNVTLVPQPCNSHNLFNHFEDSEKQENHFRFFFKEIGWI